MWLLRQNYAAATREAKDSSLGILAARAERKDFQRLAKTH
jgi:hypothetical protein